MNNILIMPLGERQPEQPFDTGLMTPAEEAAHLREMYSTRLPEVARRAHSRKPLEVESPEWAQQVGRYWREARRGNNLLIREAANTSGIPLSQLIFLEAGMALEGELKGDLLPSYALALGKPELYTAFKARFESPNWHEGTKLPGYGDPKLTAPIFGKDLKGFAKAVAVGTAVGVAGVAVNAIARRIRG